MGLVKKEDVKKVEQKQRIIVSLDKSNEQILALESDPGIELDWDHRSFKKLPDEVTGRFKQETLKRYWIAEAKAEEYAREAVQKIQLAVNPLGNSMDSPNFKLKTRERKGWHTYWASPGADFERCMGCGKYKQIRKPTEAQEKSGFEVGEESGEVIKLLTEDLKVELIALECREEHFQEYLRWMDETSSRKYGAIKTDYMEKVEDINRGVTRRGARLEPMDLAEGN